MEKVPVPWHICAVLLPFSSWQTWLRKARKSVPTAFILQFPNDTIDGQIPRSLRRTFKSTFLGESCRMDVFKKISQEPLVWGIYIQIWEAASASEWELNKGLPPAGSQDVAHLGEIHPLEHRWKRESSQWLPGGFVFVWIRRCKAVNLPSVESTLLVGGWLSVYLGRTKVK